MERIAFFLIFVGACILAHGQAAVPPNLRAQMTLNRLSQSPNGINTNELVYGIPMEPGKVVGDYYLDKKWNQSTILLYQSEKMLEGYLTRYDINSKVVEVKTQSGIKALDISKIKNIVWLDSLTGVAHYYVNSKEFRYEDVPLVGLLEVIVDGDLPLLKQTGLTVKDPTYVAAFDVGSRDTKIQKKETFYFARDKHMHELKNKKDLQSAAEERYPEIEAYIKQNKLNINKQDGLASVFLYLNK